MTKSKKNIKVKKVKTKIENNDLFLNDSTKIETKIENNDLFLNDSTKIETKIENNDLFLNSSINIESENIIVSTNQNNILSETTSDLILFIDREKGFTYVKEGNFRKKYNSVQYNFTSQTQETALVVADGIKIGILAVNFIGKEKHQLSDIELEALEEERIKKESFIVKS